MSGEKADTRRRMEKQIGYLRQQGMTSQQAQKAARESAIRYDQRNERKKNSGK